MPRQRFHAQIVAALSDIVGMVDLVRAAVTQGTDAMLTADVALADRVIAQDDVIDDLYRRLESRLYEMLARQAPVAGDLRALMAIVRIIGDLERAGDLAQNIAVAVRRVCPPSLPQPAAELIAGMGRQACALLAEAGHAVRDLEPETAERLDLMDDEMDLLGRTMLDRLESPGLVDIRTAMELALVTRHFERIGDHAVAVAERVEFLVTGSAHEAHVGL